MVDGIEGIGGYGGGREHPGGRAAPSGAPSPTLPSPAMPQSQEPATFAPIADLLDHVARLAADTDQVSPDAEGAGVVAARLLAGAEAALASQARLGEACVRALLEPVATPVPPAR